MIYWWVSAWSVKEGEASPETLRRRTVRYSLEACRVDSKSAFARINTFFHLINFYSIKSDTLKYREAQMLNLKYQVIQVHQENSRSCWGSYQMTRTKTTAVQLVRGISIRQPHSWGSLGSHGWRTSVATLLQLISSESWQLFSGGGYVFPYFYLIYE